MKRKPITNSKNVMTLGTAGRGMSFTNKIHLLSEYAKEKTVAITDPKSDFLTKTKDGAIQ